MPSQKDFDLAQDKDLESLRFYRVEPGMEIDIGADLLHRCLKAAHARNAVPQFMKRLEWYVRSEIGRFHDLQDEVYQEIRQWGEENVGTGKSYPKTFLFPRSVEPFKRAKRRADEAIAAIADREKQTEQIPRRSPPAFDYRTGNPLKVGKTIKK